MLQKEFLENLEHMARKTKEKISRRRPTDMAATVIGHRGEDPVIQVTMNGFSNSELFNVAHHVANGLDCDAIGLVNESYLAGLNENGETFTINPLTGEPWDSSKNEMHIAATKHDGLGQGWVTEILLTVCVNRSGDVGFGYLPYKYVGGKHLHWIEDSRAAWTTVDEGNEVTGTVATGLRKIMNHPTLEQSLSRLPDLSALVAGVDRDQRDAIIARRIANRGHAPMLFAEQGSRRAATLDKEEGTERFSMTDDQP